MAVVHVERGERLRIIRRDERRPERGGNMSGETDKAAWEDDYEMEPEYDFSNSVPNPYADD